MIHRRQRISGWGRQPASEADCFRPESLGALEAALVARDGVLARGLGRSYGDSGFNSAGATILMERLDRVLEFDPTTGWLRAEAGVSLREIAEVFVPRGFFLPVTPGTQQVTLGGAVASDVHGKEHHAAGSFSNHVSELALLLADGSAVRCSRERDPELFWATLGGMGLTGIVTEVTLRLRPIESAYLSVDTDRLGDLDAVLARFADDDRYGYSVAWIDCLARGRALGRSVLLRGNWLAKKDLPARLAAAPLGVSRRRLPAVPFDLPGWLLNPLLIRAMNFAIFHRAPRMRRDACTAFAPFLYPLDVVGQLNRIYGRRGFFQYQFVLPPGSERGLTEILELLARSGLGSFLAVLKKFGQVDPATLLSFPRPGYTLALDFPNTGGRLLELFNELDRRVLEHGGRVYLAKDARLSPETFRAMYPQLERFLAIKRRVDPHGRFSSDQSRRLGIAV